MVNAESANLVRGSAGSFNRDKAVLGVDLRSMRVDIYIDIDGCLLCFGCG